jgi:hypothetical protein
VAIIAPDGTASQNSLEPLTQVINEARTDNGSGKGEQSEMNAETTLETDAQFAETRKPGRFGKVDANYALTAISHCSSAGLTEHVGHP